MFIQVIEGRPADREALLAAFDRWQSDLAPEAVGWLGTTAGLTEDRAVILARFTSLEDAMRNSGRPEQDRWWSETAACFDGEPTFDNSTEVIEELVGDPDQAGFVQVMRGSVSDVDRMRELQSAGSQIWAAHRPEILGMVTALHDGGRFTTAVYFTSEAEARAGEAKEVPAEVRAQLAEMGSLMGSETTFYDLREPLLRSASDR